MTLEAPAVGSTVGPWLILERWGSGSFGIIYKARRVGHPDGPFVALKLARRPQDPRFLREAELLQRCPHSSIPQYEDQGFWTGPAQRQYPYVVMEWVEGLTLYDWLQKKQRTSREVLHVLAQVASALAAAHAKGAVHRDVKGDNLRVTAEGRAVLVDWGSGWFAGAHPLTDTPVPPGTTAYRPPEQRFFQLKHRMDFEARWESKRSDDLYSLGVTFYRLVTGVYLPPLTEGGEPVAQWKVLPPSIMGTVSTELEAIIVRLISEDPQTRGTAEQTAREAAVLMRTAGPEADQPILPTPCAELTEEGDRYTSETSVSEEFSDTDPARSHSDAPARGQRMRETFLLRLVASWAAAAMVGGFVVGAMLEPSERSSPERAPWIAPPEEVAQFAPDAGVSEEALSSVHDVPRAVVPYLTVGRPMLKQPLDGQRRPPCGRGETPINGGCWVEVGREKPPCGDKMFEYEGYCYLPSFDEPPRPTSNPPE
ncbi:MAG TPA: serine/threonine-protein kinase [Hyalangium sp.]|nr:serine/threonine-protein kinase [Hyalangium sp.]